MVEAGQVGQWKAKLVVTMEKVVSRSQDKRSGGGDGGWRGAAEVTSGERGQK